MLNILFVLIYFLFWTMFWIYINIITVLLMDFLKLLAEINKAAWIGHLYSHKWT